MGYINGEYRLETGDVWRHAGPCGWIRIVHVTMPGYPDEQGMPGFSFIETIFSGRWSRQKRGWFAVCRSTADFLKHMEEHCRFFVGKWKGDGRTGYDRNPLARRMVLESLEPLLVEAESKGLWVQPALGELMPVHELRKQHAQDEYIFGPRSFHLVNPAARAQQLADNVAKEQAVLDAFLARMAAAGVRVPREDDHA